MPIFFCLDKILHQKNLHLDEVSEATGISMSRLRRMKSGNMKEVNLATLNTLCELLDCQPADILEYNNTQED